MAATRRWRQHQRRRRQREARRRRTAQWQQRGSSSANAATVAAAQQQDGGSSLAAARRQRQWRQCDSAMSEAAWRRQREAQRQRTVRWQQCSGSSAKAAAVAAARQSDVDGSLVALWRWRQCQRRWWQHKMRQRCTAQRRQHSGSSAEAAADSPAPFTNAWTHAPLNATDAPTYASLSLVEDKGTTAPTASLLLVGAATAAPVAMSTAVADAPTPPTPTPPPMILPTLMATPMTSFVKLNLI